MSVEDQYREVVRIARALGATIEELDGCYGGGNGSSWAVGLPVGGVNHHFVADSHVGDPQAAEATRLSCIQMLKDGYGDLAGAGRVVNWFVGASGVGTLIGTQPCNHAGKGDTNVLAAVQADQPPGAPHPPNNDGNGNRWFSGKETQHMGDGSPYPDALIETLVCIDAAECVVFGWSENRQIMHYTWTNRKIDMSWLGGSDTAAGQAELCRRIAAKVTAYKNGGSTPPPPPPKDWLDMATKDDVIALVKLQQPALVEFFTIGTTVYEADLVGGTYRGVHSGPALTARRHFLDSKGIKYTVDPKPRPDASGYGPAEGII